ARFDARRRLKRRSALSSPCHASRTKGSSGFSHQGLAGTDPCGFRYVIAKLEMIRRQHDNRRSVLEPPELLAFADIDIAREDSWSSRSGIEHDIQKMQPDTGDQNRRDRYQG